MKYYRYPEKASWSDLSQRANFPKASLDELLRNIFKNVQQNKDQALFEYTEKFDKVKLEQLQVAAADIEQASRQISAELKNAIQLAKANIEKFHLAQQEKEEKIETAPGVLCWRKSVGIEKVGLYIPGGSAPLFSTILMLGIPAKIAGCQEVVLCTPPKANGKIHPAILYTAQLVGIKKIYKLGGAQAIAAMAFGTATIPKVYKIFGPGNQFVTKAKEMVQTYGIAIDMPAGPSEVLIIADKTSRPEFVAADLLSQLEHGADSQAILLSAEQSIIEATRLALQRQLQGLPRRAIAEKALANSRAILLEDLDACFAFSNLYAPEHLIVAAENAEKYSDKIINAGSVFLGNYSCESAGDYASGTNHTLPTNGYAKTYSGVSVDSFVRKISFQKISKAGIRQIGKAIECMAEAEELMAHKQAVSLRLKS